MFLMKIDYIEIPTADLPATKAFYTAVFDWAFKDWGDVYADTPSGGITAGLSASADRTRAPLVTCYADDLEGARERVLRAGGKITLDIFAFPGGRRFHFSDPAGNELAVWTKTS
jgi:uncharacterized protein